MLAASTLKRGFLILSISKKTVSFNLFQVGLQQAIASSSLFSFSGQLMNVYFTLKVLQMQGELRSVSTVFQVKEVPFGNIKNGWKTVKTTTEIHFYKKQDIPGSRPPENEHNLEITVFL